MTTMMEEEAAAATVMEEETAMAETRIFLGGLGVTVTEDHLRSAFSSLGSINSVQIIRDKGRSMAYFDFLPSSEKSLSKLFSMYNGCIWKGGRLRLEKAKEHYTTRMQREWMEDAKPSIIESIDVDVDDTTKITDVPSKLKKLSKEDQPMLRIFFPSFRKVKLLPKNGTGKHKYSFQRVNVPSMPVHFCDCEEHSGSANAAKQEAHALEVLAGGVDDQEFNIMHNVMNKLFAKQNKLGPITDDNELVKGQRSTSIEDKLPVDKEVTNEIIDDDNDDDIVDDDDDIVDDIVDDDDDFVMNLTVGRKDQMDNFMSAENRTIVQNKASLDKPSNVASTTNEISRRRKSYLNEGVEREKNSSTTLANDLVNDDNLLINVVTGCTTKSRLEEEAAVVHQVSKKKRAGSVTETNVELPSKKRKSSTSEGHEAVVVVAKPKARWNERMSIKPDQSSGKGMIDLSSRISIPSVDSTTITLADAALTHEVPKLDETEMPVDKKQPEKDEHIVPNEVAKIDETEMPVDEKDEPIVDKTEQGIESNSFVEQRSEEMYKDSEGDNNKEATTNKAVNSGRGDFWRNKSSWIKLIGGENNSFSISQILPTSTTFANQEPELLGITTGFTLSANMGEHLKPKNVEEKTGPKKHPAIVSKDVVSAEVPPVVSYTIGETCSFMKSDSSMKEWKKAKAAVCGSFKKKGKEKEK
ncbi:protein REPRESSOR OF SILENCING 3 [Impatiens glandulifera]|uniref:protein REPRESSOR OF SILENCING 3 n=1 Tax=Impatiens glandulifera TaxID=253017 RepID=UPI001FB0CF3A|nr:protein REPRESSOR OF SILENCING 3 [Impatiens glandulifera]